MRSKSNGAGTVIQAAREKCGLSRNELALLASISITTLTRIELGWCMPSADLLDKLAKVLKLTAASVIQMHKAQNLYLLSLTEKAKSGQKEAPSK